MRFISTCFICICTWLLSFSSAYGGEYVGFPDRYSTKLGDLNSDGLSDLYLQFNRPIIPVVMDGILIPIGPPDPVEQFVLQQNNDGSFNTVSNLNSTQRALISSWSTASIDLEYDDLNVDGYIDIAIRGLASLIPQALDAVVFAPSAFGGSPPHVLAWKEDTATFFRDVNGWVADPNDYFDDGWFQACQGGYYWVYNPFAGGDYFDGGQWELVPVVTCGWYFDPAGFSETALEFLSYFVTSLTYGDLIPGEYEAPVISEILAEVLGIPVMRGTLESGDSNFGVAPNLLAALEDDSEPDLLDQFLEALRLERLFQEIFRTQRQEVLNEICEPVGTPHLYDFTQQVCDSTSPGCTLPNVYFGEMLYHPVTGYWDNTVQIQDGQKGYAEMGCTDEISGACDPIEMLGIDIPGVGILDGGPIHIERYDAQLTYVNVTELGHLFHPGTVTRTSVSGNSGTAIRTVGEGTGQCPLINEVGGIYMFHTLNRFIKCHLAGGCGRVHPFP